MPLQRVPLGLAHQEHAIVPEHDGSHAHDGHR